MGLGVGDSVGFIVSSTGTGIGASDFFVGSKVVLGFGLPIGGLVHLTTDLAPLPDLPTLEILELLAIFALLATLPLFVS